ncbi:hypothetical protein HBB16_14510 [Pseudonocardia sp. MCCB 268]|nr:hypothetical protein [Pseudonocardia cytotoxica]
MTRLRTTVPLPLAAGPGRANVATVRDAGCDDSGPLRAAPRRDLVTRSAVVSTRPTWSSRRRRPPRTGLGPEQSRS